MGMSKMMTAKEVSAEMGVSAATAYKIIRELNEELRKAGYVTVSGKVPTAYWNKKFYGSEAAV